MARIGTNVDFMKALTQNPEEFEKLKGLLEKLMVLLNQKTSTILQHLMNLNLVFHNILNKVVVQETI